MKKLSVRPSSVFAIPALAVLLCLVFAVPVETQATQTSELTDYLRQEISTARAAIDGTPATPLKGAVDEFYYSRFWLRVQLRAGFSLPGMLTLSVIPEVEMLWQRSLPEGWVSYKPARTN